MKKFAWLLGVVIVLLLAYIAVQVTPPEPPKPTMEDFMYPHLKGR